MIIVAADQDEVEADLRAGRLACPPCGGELRPWGHGRPRVLRRRAGRQDRLRVRRARCRRCKVTQSLLRRLDDAETIGVAIEAKAAGHGHRPIAAALERPKDTVRGWLRAFSRATRRCGVGDSRAALLSGPALLAAQTSARVYLLGSTRTGLGGRRGVFEVEVEARRDREHCGAW